jgi:hypothetical protein
MAFQVAVSIVCHGNYNRLGSGSLCDCGSSPLQPVTLPLRRYGQGRAMISLTPLARSARPVSPRYARSEAFVLLGKLATKKGRVTMHLYLRDVSALDNWSAFQVRLPEPDCPPSAKDGHSAAWRQRPLSTHCGHPPRMSAYDPFRTSAHSNCREWR